MSHPSRVRGLKSGYLVISRANKAVAPFTGAWIEISIQIHLYSPSYVAPFTGAWIEIDLDFGGRQSCPVAPFTGAWIEIYYNWSWTGIRIRRTLHGCVD